ncbi:MAG: hypothetical protein A2Z75_07280 [Chloroflexi bacterium RBG_13_50_10]|nr:MAG: hypothetical protein A2Z75_07280 [Chloroflexi bacterium RBG_13_50_10]
MNKKFWLLFLVVVVLILVTSLLVSCVGEKGGTISDVALSTEVDSHDRPLQPASVFSPETEKIYCSFKLSGVPSGSRIKAEWMYVGTGVEKEDNTDNTGLVLPEILLEELTGPRVFQTQTGTITGSGYTASVFEQSNPDIILPLGDYKVVLYINDQEKASVSFKVQGN